MFLCQWNKWVFPTYRNSTILSALALYHQIPVEIAESGVDLIERIIIGVFVVEIFFGDEKMTTLGKRLLSWQGLLHLKRNVEFLVNN